MQVKAVVWRPDRTNDIVILKKKDIEGKSFRHDGVTYFLHADRFMVTWNRSARSLWTRSYYATYYFIQGVSKPVPVPDFEFSDEPIMEPILDASGKPLLGGPDGKTPQMQAKRDTNGRVLTRQTFPRIINNGIPGEELAAIFNPWFYRIIAQHGKTAWERLEFYLLLGAIALGCYNAYRIGQMPTLEEITAAVNAGRREA